MTEEYGPIRNESKAELEEFLRNQDYISFVGMIAPRRPGVQLCFVTLEYRYYIPDTPRNEKYFLRIFEWQNTVWAMVSIPREDKHLMEEVAAECGLRIADGIPHMISAEGVIPFPAGTNNVFTLENISGHEVYENDPQKNLLLMQDERAKIEKIFADWSSRN